MRSANCEFRPVFEQLESRQFLSVASSTITDLGSYTAQSTQITTLAAVNVDGTYAGNATINGGTSKIALSVIVSGKGTKVRFTIPVRSGFTIKPSIKTVFVDKGTKGMVATYTTPIGGGTITIKKGVLTLTGSFDPLFVDPFTVRVDAKKSATTSALTKAAPAITTLAVNPLVGSFSGKFTVGGPIAATFPYTAVIKTKAGSSRLSMVLSITIPNFGDLQLSFGVTPNSAGKFTVNIGSTSAAGTLGGRFSGGKLILTFTIPGTPTISGSAVRV